MKGNPESIWILLACFCGGVHNSRAIAYECPNCGGDGALLTQEEYDARLAQIEAKEPANV